MADNAFQPGDVWLEYEQGCLHEHRNDLLQDLDVLMPQLSKGYPFIAGAIQKYVAKDGKERWRSLTPKRDTFRDGYTNRERCAQELVRDCPATQKRISYRKQLLGKL